MLALNQHAIEDAAGAVDRKAPERRPVLARVLALLPADGSSLLLDQVLDAARAAGLRGRAASSALMALCTEGSAAVELRGGYDFVRRRLVGDEGDFPLRERPARPPPRLRGARR